MIVNGWRLYIHPLLEAHVRQLVERVNTLSMRDPQGYTEHPAAKLLDTVNRHMREVVPRDPNAPEFRQGSALGVNNRHWFRAKFHHRYRLFYRFSSKEKTIVYVWINDESTLRKAGSKTDPYAVFRAMLESGDPPSSMEALVGQSREM
jgi:toxin YhaV